MSEAGVTNLEDIGGQNDGPVQLAVVVAFDVWLEQCQEAGGLAGGAGGFWGGGDSVTDGSLGNVVARAGRLGNRKIGEALGRRGREPAGVINDLVEELEALAKSGMVFAEHLANDEWVEGTDEGKGGNIHQLLKDRKSTRLNSRHIPLSRMPSSPCK